MKERLICGAFASIYVVCALGTAIVDRNPFEATAWASAAFWCVISLLLTGDKP